nr:MAG TPA: hypothetical protein [Bacteriophage sp.]
MSLHQLTALSRALSGVSLSLLVQRMSLTPTFLRALQ